jgi:hypothetical protein
VPTVSVDARQLKRMVGGSTRAHHALVAACLDWLALHRIVAVPISTSGIPVQRSDGRLDLQTNERQEGFSDVVICLPPTGRMGLIEMKTGDASRRRSQIEMQDRFRAQGALCLVVHDVQDLERALRCHVGPARLVSSTVDPRREAS